MTHKFGHNPANRRNTRASGARGRARRAAGAAARSGRVRSTGRTRTRGNITGQTGARRTTVRTTSGAFRILPNTQFSIARGATTPMSGSPGSFTAGIGQFDFARKRRP